MKNSTRTSVIRAKAATALLITTAFICPTGCEDIPERPEDTPADEWGAAPSIIVGERKVILIPWQDYQEGTASFEVTGLDEQGTVEATCNAGLEMVTRTDRHSGEGTVIIRAAKAWASGATVTLTASNAYGRSQASIAVEAAFLSTDRDHIALCGEGESCEITVRANVTYGVFCEAGWVHVTTGEGKVTISADANGAEEARTAELILQISGGHIRTTVSIMQKGVEKQTDINDERKALEAIYRALGGENWNDNEGWCTDAPLDEWTGVMTKRINGVEHVQYLHIQCQNAVGEIPEEIGDLEYITELWIIQEPGITGTIPESMKNLRRLADLAVVETSITGEIPEFFSKMECLRSLGLSDNRLTGGLPLWLADTGIEVFRFGGNCLDGEIDSSLTRTPWWNILTQNTFEPIGESDLKYGQKYPHRLWLRGKENDETMYSDRH